MFPFDPSSDRGVVAAPQGHGPLARYHGGDEVERLVTSIEEGLKQESEFVARVDVVPVGRPARGGGTATKPWDLPRIALARRLGAGEAVLPGQRLAGNPWSLKTLAGSQL
jgi:hypothetical protein